MSRLQGKYALITGGTSGIGLETARQFIAEGATVAITGRSQRALDAAGQALAGNALLLLSDAGDIPQQRALAQQLEQRWPRLDVLYVNAGDVTHRPLQEWDEQSYQRLMDINLKGPFFLIQALLPLLATPSSVILCGSVSAHIGLPQSSAYAASKAGLLSLARTLSGELHARGIRVNGLSPGPTETPALGKLGLTEADERALRDDIRALVPIGRMGSALELAKAAVFLAADESAFMVGAELQMDGGVGNL
ncbi:SDR family oxidoreductase [Serratia bockelmannii]|jgi:NAD(P)-dependent dehydrogenase (short-subunit alcohol dehydrogenase family)|uniref:SDR family oxidoreductase n=1 Tax=Serratia TaxID=613 RepID=UPI000F8DB5FD|nr:MULTISPECIES: SDR family oxidoreductase [Serratia]MBH2747266.1 SDR family oxidoreductase [Serratia marcescens]MBH2968221.1 SDR family oxidoreductase [Serratia marcescens]MBN6136297.1 SDR family oxidoreductase [Serratia marcescens]MEB7509067.1 SDR family oxidoreductase [Serratia marcescens]TXE51139.1 SDR family oxidoreductase [Serratia bockelmannii]